MKQRDKILEAVRLVPTMPVAAVEVVRLLEDMDVPMEKIVRAVEHDPGLTSNLLRLANSPFFATKREVGSVREAAMQLGMNWMFQMVIGTVISPLTHQRIKGYDMPPGQLLTHSVAVAEGAEQIARVLRVKVPHYLFTAGLLHDLGKVVLGTFVAVDTSPITALCREEDLSFEEAEKQILGIDHAEVGAELLHWWKLPEAVAEAVHWHHQPEKFSGDTTVVDLVHVADNLALLCGLGIGSDGLRYRPSWQAAERLALSAEQAELAVCEVMSKLEEWRGLLSGSPGKNEAADEQLTTTTKNTKNTKF